MEIQKLESILKAKAYPGRGIVIGKSDDGRHAVVAYFIMGRSSNSRNRIFETVRDGIRTRAFDESKLEDPSLIIYAPVRVLGPDTIVTNGDQTDTVYEGLRAGLTFEESLLSRTFEPDGPNYTPRISGLLHVEEGEFSYKISILKSADNRPDSARRYTFTYNPALAGEGHFISTYIDDGTPLPSFEGEPIKVSIPNDLDGFTDLVWKALNEENKVSLFTRFIDLETGKFETRIVNKNQ